MKKKILLFSVLLFSLLVSVKVLASTPNWGKSTESKPIGLFFTGYVQCQPSYYDSRGGHAVFGWFQYTNTADDSRYYTEAGINKYDSNIYTKSKVIRDIWGFGHEKAEFDYGFFWAGNGDNWPTPARIKEELNKDKLKGYSMLAQ